MTDALFRDLMRLAQTDERVAKLLNKHDVAGMINSPTAEPKVPEEKPKKTSFFRTKKED